VTGYVVVATPGGTKVNITPTASRMSAVVGGLTNGTPYTFTVTATNKLGTGPAVMTNQVTPAGVPIVNISSTSLVGDGRTIRVILSVDANGSQVTSCHAVASGVVDQPGGCGGIDVSVPNWSTAYDVYAYVTTAGGLTGTSSHVGVTTGAQPCAQWSGYAQNQWPPAGATIRNVPDKAGASVGGISGNTPITFDKWTVGGAAPFPGNPAPYNSNQWLHLADGRGWVSYAGTRATQMTYDASGGGPPGPAVPLPPECRV
jgi:hypothetical protein